MDSIIINRSFEGTTIHQLVSFSPDHHAVVLLAPLFDTDVERAEYMAGLASLPHDPEFFPMPSVYCMRTPEAAVRVFELENIIEGIYADVRAFGAPIECATNGAQKFHRELDALFEEQGAGYIPLD